VPVRRLVSQVDAGDPLDAPDTSRTESIRQSVTCRPIAFAHRLSLQTSRSLQGFRQSADDCGVPDRTRQGPDAVAPDTKSGTAPSLWHQASRSRRTKAVATAILVFLAFLVGGIYCLASNDRGDGMFILVLAPFTGIGFFFESLGYRHRVSGTLDTQTGTLWRSTEGGYWQDSRTERRGTATGK